MRGTAALPTTASRWSMKSTRWMLTALLLLVALVYWPGLGGGFVFDDYPNIVDNTKLHVGPGSGVREWLGATFSSPALDLKRPLAMLSFAVNHAWTGLDPYWMKLTNLGIHLLNTILVFGLCRRLLSAATPQQGMDGTTNNNRVALWIAAAWALNPINLMAVLLAVQRMESLSHTFVYAGLWLYLVGRVRLKATGHGWTPLATGLLGGVLLGALVKESAVLLPLYALTLEWALLSFATHRQMPDRRLLLVFGCVLVLPALLGVAWLLPGVMQPDAFAGRNFSLGERLLTEGRVLADYLHWTLLPNLGQLSLYHDDYSVSYGLLSPPSTLVAWLLLATLAAATFWLRKRRPLMALGLAWFFCAHLLTATIIPLELVFEHRNYFASLGLCLLLADVLLRLPRGRNQQRIGIAAATALLFLYSGLTALRANEWRNPLVFSITEAAKHPQSPRATYDVARNLIILSEYQAGSPYLPQAFDALERAMAVPGSTPLPESAAITLAARTNTRIRKEWWTRLQDKLIDHPIGPQQEGSLRTLVACNLRNDCPLPETEMINTFLAALDCGPRPEVMNIYGNYALNVLHDPDLALRLWHDTATLAPEVVEYQATLAKLMIASGRPKEATTYIEKIRELGLMGENEAKAYELEILAARELHDRLQSDTRTQALDEDP